MTIKDLTERFDIPLMEATIDEVNKIIQNVLIAGTRVSKNGYTYTEKAWNSLVSLVEGAKNFVDHPSKQDLKDRDGVRSVKDFAGIFKNVKRMGDKISASLHLGEQYFPLYKDLVELQPANVGMSVNVRAKVFVDNTGKESIVDIDKLHSVDLVSSASLTDTLFESYRSKNDDNLDIKNAIVKEIKEDFITLIVEGSEMNIDTEELDPKTVKVGDEIEVYIDKEEGVLSDKIADDEIRDKANSLMYKANDMIDEIMRDKDEKFKTFSEKRKQINSVLDDLEKELNKILPKIKSEKEANDMSNLTEKAIKGLESLGEKAEQDKDKESVIDAVKRGDYRSNNPNDPIEIAENKKLEKAEKERLRLEAQAKKPVSDKDKKAVLNSVKK